MMKNTSVLVAGHADALDVAVVLNAGASNIRVMNGIERLSVDVAAHGGANGDFLVCNISAGRAILIHGGAGDDRPEISGWENAAGDPNEASSKTGSIHSAAPLD